MVSCDYQPGLAEWLCRKIGLAPTPHIQCIGNVTQKGILGVVGYDQFNKASVVMHVAGEPGWLTRSLIWAAFDYPFNVCGVNVVIAPIASTNTKSLTLVKRLGFELSTVIPDAHPDGDLVLLTMRRDQCRYLSRKHNG